MFIVNFIYILKTNLFCFMYMLKYLNVKIFEYNIYLYFFNNLKIQSIYIKFINLFYFNIL